MNVCLTNDSFPPLIDGVANAVLNYAAIIQRKYGNAVVATPDYPGIIDEYPFDVVRYPSVDTSGLVGYRAGYPFSFATMHKLKGHNLEIIHSHCPVASLLLARQLREVAEVPVVFTYHTKFDIDIKKALKLKIIQEKAINLLVKNIEACDEVWVVSHGAGENLKGLGYQGEYRIMENGVDLPKGPVPISITKELSRKYDLIDDVPLFLFVGRLMWYKGTRIILDGLLGLKKSGHAFKMVFVGDGIDRNEIESYTHEIGLSQECIFTGAIHDREILRQWYSLSDLFLFPSTFDTNGIVVREAAACSLASVLIKGSCAAEGITDGRNGILIEENAEAMTQALVCIANNRSRLKELGANAGRDLYCSWEQSVDRAVGYYNELIIKYKNKHVVRSHADFDSTFKLLGDIYKGLDKVRTTNNAVFSAAAPELFKESKALASAKKLFQEDIKKQYEKIQDYLDRYL